MECEWSDGYHFQARPIKTSHLCPPCSFHLCLAGEHDDFGSYMIQFSIHRRKGAWILKSPLGGEPSTDPKFLFYLSVQFSSVQSLSRVRLFVTPWTAACQASLSITNCQNLPKPMSIELVMPSNHLILCRPLLLLPSIFPSIRVFSNESALFIRWPKYWSFSFNISPSNEHWELISFRMDWLDFLAV